MPHSTDRQRIEDCRRIYLKLNGRHHEQIEREMRALGHTRFRRRVLYRRNERGRSVPGWIERYGWDALSGKGEKRRRGERKKRGRACAHGQEGALAPRPSGKFNHSKWRRSIGGRPRSRRHLAALPPDHRAAATRCGSPTVREDHAFNAECIALAHARASATSAVTARSSDGEAADNSPNSMNSKDFYSWLISVSPYMTWDAAHHRHIIDTLERVTSGECKRLMIFMPPRHGKSELVTVRYAAWRIKQKPDMNVIIGSYNQRLANRFSRKIKTVLCDAITIEQKEGKSGGKPPFQTLEHEDVEEKPANSRHLEVRKASLPPPDVHDHSSPFPFSRVRLKNSESEWETRAGGGLRAVGVGSGVTGFGANLIIVDDPVKSRAEAESIKYRERVHDWFNDDLYTRLEPNGQIILIQTRWHEDDLAGRLLAEENGSEWTVINLPAIAEETSAVLSPKGTQIIAQGKAAGRDPGNESINESDPEGVEQSTAEIAPLQGADSSVPVPGVPLPSVAHPRLLSLSPSGTGRVADATCVDVIGRNAGDALWPARFDERHLENTKEKIGSYSFASLYQQHPVPAEGGLFKREWFRHIVDRPPHGLIWKRGYDLGITANPTSDHTASYRVAYDKEGILYIDGGYRRRIEYPDQRRYILGRIREELDTEHGIEDTANGSAVVQELRKEVRLQGRAFRAVKPKGDKVTRCLAWMNLAEAGKVRLVRAAWNKEFIDECCAFPLGTHDDQIDAVSIAVAMHTRKRYGFYTF